MTCETTSNTSNPYTVSVSGSSASVVVSGVGQQGPVGDSISNAYIDSNYNLHLIVVDASGNQVADINAGFVAGDFVPTVIDPVEGDIIQYDSNTSAFVNHPLTTSRILDIDNTNKQDGAVLVYNGTTSKYISTTTLDNPNTIINGGSY